MAAAAGIRKARGMARLAAGHAVDIRDRFGWDVIGYGSSDISRSVPD